MSVGTCVAHLLFTLLCSQLGSEFASYQYEDVLTEHRRELAELRKSLRRLRVAHGLRWLFKES